MLHRNKPRDTIGVLRQFGFVIDPHAAYRAVTCDFCTQCTAFDHGPDRTPQVLAGVLRPETI